MEKFREERTTVAIPRELRDWAHNARINVSDVTRKALIAAREKSEEQTGVPATRQSPPDTTTCKGRAQNV